MAEGGLYEYYERNGGMGSQAAEYRPLTPVETMAYRKVVEMVLSHRQLLGISDWDVRVTDVEGLYPTHYAAIDIRDLERVAQIKVDRRVIESGKVEFIGRCIAHELLHLVLHRLEDLVNRSISLLPEGERELMADLVHEELENVVDNLAGLISPGERFVALDAEEHANWPSFGKGLFVGQ